jgi:hypothetical protein
MSDAKKYAVKFESSRPAGDWKSVVSLKRKWALVRFGNGVGYTVVSRFGSQEAAQFALEKVSV